MTAANRSNALEPQVKTTYGWSAEGKTPAEIAGDIRHTKYRIDADVDAIKQTLKRRVARVKWPAVAVGFAALFAFLIRRIRR